MEKKPYVAWVAELAPLPHLRPTEGTDYEHGMERHCPFIVTRPIARTDLGDCIISTTAPHYVCKVRAFPTNAGENPSPMKLQTATRAEKERCEYLTRRLALIEGGAELFPTFDREMDEPRIVAKVPGMNVYLELFGCLDRTISEKDGNRGTTVVSGSAACVNWREAMETMTEMALWMPNNWPLRERRRFATVSADWQPISAWQQDYNQTVRPTLIRKAGIGIWPDIDPSRRPELLYSKTSLNVNPDEDIASIKFIKRATANLAAQGYHNRPTDED